MVRFPLRDGAITPPRGWDHSSRWCDYLSEMVRSLFEMVRLPLRDGAITLREGATTSPRWCDHISPTVPCLERLISTPLGRPAIARSARPPTTRQQLPSAYGPPTPC